MMIRQLLGRRRGAPRRGTRTVATVLAFTLVSAGVSGVATAATSSGPGPRGPGQAAGSAEGLGHEVGAGSTRHGGGVGHAPGHAKGELGPYVRRTRQVTPHATGPDVSGPLDMRTAKRHPELSGDRFDVFQDAVGRVQKRVTGHRINFKDPTGTWTPIDPAWKAGAGGRYGQKSNDLGADIAPSADDPDLIKFSPDAAHTVGQGLIGAAKTTPQVNGTTATYPDVLTNIDLVLASGGSGIEENIILKTAAAPTTWTYNLDLKGVTAKLNPDGGIDYLDSTGAVIGQSPRGFMTDSKIDGGGSGAFSDAVTYTLNTVGGKQQLTVTVDDRWVHDPARQFPITVDPTYNSTSSGNHGYSTYVDKKTPSTNRSGEHTVAIGTWNGNTSSPDLDNTFLDFSGFGGAPAGKHATGATLNMFMVYDPDCSARQMEVRLTTANPAWTAAGTTTYPGAAFNTAATIGTATPSPTSAVCNNGAVNQSTGQWVAIPLSANFDNPNNGSDIGLAVKALDSQNGQTVSWKRFDSVNGPTQYVPYITVTYNDDVPPQVDYELAGNTSTLTPEFTATGHDPDNFPSAIKYDFQVWKADASGNKIGGPVADSTNITTNTWSVPAAAGLTWATNYVWQASVTDGVLTGVGPLNPFITTVPQPAVSSTFGRDAGIKGFDSDTGNATVTATDAKVATVGPAMDITRVYNSKDATTTGAFGAGWTSPLDMAATEVKDATGTITTLVLTHPDGHRVAFGRNSDGTFVPQQGMFATLTSAAGSYTLTDKNAVVWVFAHARTGGGVFGISSVTDALGRALNFTWTGDQITKATTASGRSLTFTWNTPGTGASAHVATVVTDKGAPGDPGAPTWNYAYIGDRLTSVCPPTSTTVCETYNWQNGSHYPTAVLDSDPYNYWRLGEPSGVYAHDTVGQNEAAVPAAYTGTAMGSTASPVANGQATATDFNGSSSFVLLPNTDPTLTLGSMSVSLWFKTTTNNAVLLGWQDDPISAGTTTNPYIPSLYVGNDSKLHAQLAWGGNATPTASAAAVTDGRWHQAVITATNLPSPSQTFYLDGVAVGSKAQNAYFGDPLGRVTVGAGFLGNAWPNQSNSGTAKASFFNGSISDVSVHNRPLSAREVAALYGAATAAPASLLVSATTPAGHTVQQVTWDVPNDAAASIVDSAGGTWTRKPPTITGGSGAFVAAVRAASPKVYWRLGETYAAQGIDQMSPTGPGGGNYTTYNNVTQGQTGPFGVGDSTAVAFDGATSDMTGPATLDLADGQSALSLGIWFQTTHPGGVLFGYQQDPLSNGTTPNYTPALYIGTDGKLYGEVWNGRVAPLSSSGTVTDGAWHYAVIAGGNGSQMLYLDGVAVSVTPLSGTIAVSGNQPVTTVGAGYIGDGWPAQAHGGGASYVSRFNGNLAEAAGYQSALTPTQVLAGWSTYDPNATAPASPVKNVTVTDPSGKTVTDTYDPFNSDRAVAHTDTLGHTTITGYDTSGFPAGFTDADGNTETTTNDPRGNRLTRTTCQNRQGKQCSTAYWAYTPITGKLIDPTYDRPVTFADPRSSSSTDTTYRTSTAYNTYGQPTTVTGPPVPGFPSGRVTTTTYTDATTAAADSGHPPIGLIASITTPAGAVTSNTYYADGDLATVTGPTGEVTRYTYDGLGRVTTKTVVSDTYPAGLSTGFTYDQLGRVATRTDPGVTDSVTGVVHTATTTNLYDPDSHITQATIADLTGSDRTRVLKAHFGSNGLEDSVTDATGNQTNYTYDVYGNRATVTQPDGTTTVATYDTESKLIKVTLKSYAGDPTHTAGDLVTQSRAYDPAGRLASVTDAMGWTDNYTYFDNGLTAAVVRTDSPPVAAPGQANATTSPYNPGTCTNKTGGAVDAVHCFVTESDTYDAAGYVATRTTNNGATVETHAADPAGRDATSVLDPAGVNRSTSWAFDGDDHVTNTTLSSGVVSQSVDSTWDKSGGQLTRTVHDAEGDKKTVWARDKRGLAVSMTDPLGNLTTYVNDEAGHRVTTIAPAIATETGIEGAAPSTLTPITRVGYDTFGEPVETQDANGNRTILSYDGEGRLLSRTAPSYTPPGTSTPVTPVTSFGYDVMGRLTDELDPAGNHTTRSYDQLGDLAATTAPGNATTSWVHDSNRDLLNTTSPTGAVTESTWDWLGRRKTSTADERTAGDPCHAAACTTTYAYSPANGWLSTVTSPAGVVTSWTYNNVGEATTKLDGPISAPISTTTYGYDIAGRQNTVTRADSTKRTVTFDVAGNVTGASDYDHTGALLRSTSAVFDLNDRRTSATDARGAATTWGYDAVGAVVSRSEPVATGQAIATSYAHDAVGNPTRFTDGRGSNFLTTFNSWNRVESRVEPSTAAHPNPGDRTWTLSYDNMTRVSGVAAPGGVTRTRSYDARGNLTGESGSGADAATVSRSFGYDGDDRLTSASAPGTNDAFTWTDRGLLATASGGSGASSFGWNPDGRMTSRVDAAGTSSYAWDSVGRLGSLTDASTGTTSTYGYDNVWQVRTINHGASGAVRSRTFDDLHRLATDTLKNSTGTIESQVNYGYDLNDNETTKNTGGTAGAGTNTYAYDQANRLTSWVNGSTTTPYTYDASGNRTGIGSKTLAYDARNRLTSSTDTGGTTNWNWTPRGTLASTTGAVTRSVSFDAFDQMASDTATVSGASGAQGYTYDALGRQLTSGPAGSGTGPVSALSYSGLGNDLAADSGGSYSRDPDGKVVAAKTPSGAGLVLTDRHDDVTGAFTAAGIALSASVAFDPFGAQIARTGIMPGQLGYQSGWTDPATGEVDAFSRHYEPGTSGFDSRDSANLDPAMSPGSANRYSYLAGNPLADTDPLGYCGGLFGCLKSAASSALNKVEDAGSAGVNLVSRVGSTVLGGLETVGGYVKDAASDVIDAGRQVFNGAGADIGSILGDIYAATDKYAKKAYKGGKAAVHGATRLASATYDYGTKKLAQASKALVAKAKTAGQALAKAGKLALSATKSSIKDAERTGAALAVLADQNKAAIFGAVAAITVTAGCEFLTAPASFGASTALCFAAGSAAGNAASYEASPGQHSVGGLAGTTAIGGITGAVTGGVLGKVLGLGAGSVIGESLGGAAEGTATRTATSAAETAGESIAPGAIRFSQSSVNGVDEIAASMRANGWVGAPIDVVRMPDGALTAIDNTRVLAAHQAGIDVQATVRGFDEALPEDLIGRFTTTKGGAPSTWGEALSNRIGAQTSGYRNTYPFGSPVTGWGGG